MTRGKQRRRVAKVMRAKGIEDAQPPESPPLGSAPVNREALAPNNSYGAPTFVQRGYYLDTPFRCVDCGKDEVWTATQQKWWYEVAKGFAYSTAKRCRPCRRARKPESAGRAQ